MSAKTETRIKTAGIVCVTLGAFAWFQFFARMSSGFSYSLDLNLLLLPIGVCLLNAHVFWNRITTVLLAGLMLILLLMTAILVAMDTTQFEGLWGSDYGLNPMLVHIGTVVVQLAYIGAVIAVYFVMIEGRRPGKISDPASKTDENGMI